MCYSRRDTNVFYLKVFCTCIAIVVRSPIITCYIGFTNVLAVVYKLYGFSVADSYSLYAVRILYITLNNRCIQYRCFHYIHIFCIRTRYTLRRCCRYLQGYLLGSWVIPCNSYGLAVIGYSIIIAAINCPFIRTYTAIACIIGSISNGLASAYKGCFVIAEIVIYRKCSFLFIRSQQTFRFSVFLNYFYTAERLSHYYIG